MELKPRLRRRLESARNFSEKLLEAFTTPQQWVHQVFPGANHALWFAGHIGWTDDFMISFLEPGQALHDPAVKERFGMKSTPTGKPDDYPAPDEVLARMRERRARLLAILDSLSEDDLAAPVGNGAPEFIPDKASVFEMSIWHEGFHSGQMNLARRALGNSPLFA